MRAALAVLIPLLLPLVLFVIWRKLRIDESLPRWFEDLPWVTLLASGAVLAALSLATWSFMDRAPPDATYTPPHVEDGVIVPGGFQR